MSDPFDVEQNADGGCGIWPSSCAASAMCAWRLRPTTLVEPCCPLYGGVTLIPDTQRYVGGACWSINSGIARAALSVMHYQEQAEGKRQLTDKWRETMRIDWHEEHRERRWKRGIPERGV